MDYTATTVDLLRERGIDAAFTMRPSFARADELCTRGDPGFLVVDEVSGAELAHRLAYTWPR